jgi:hypothetical protein
VSIVVMTTYRASLCSVLIVALSLAASPIVFADDAAPASTGTCTDPNSGDGQCHHHHHHHHPQGSTTTTTTTDTETPAQQ